MECATGIDKKFSSGGFSREAINIKSMAKKMSKQEESYFSFLNIVKINNHFANLQFVRQDEYPLERHFLLHSLVGCIWISSTYAEAA